MISIISIEGPLSAVSRLVCAAVAIFAIAATGLAAPGAQAVTESKPGARAVIAETVEEVLAVLRDKSVPTEDRIRSLEQIVYGRFDLVVMSRLVLARNWKRFSDEQREQYVEEFKRYLTNSYGHRIERYDQQEVEIIGEREEPRGDVVVQTKILGGEFEGALVDYRLRNKTGDWRVIDVVIEGISMVSNYRDQFKSIVSSGGPELLLKKLKEKNAAGMVIDESPPASSR
jgi:phospholipid transport system substrate-binding protein